MPAVTIRLRRDRMEDGMSTGWANIAMQLGHVLSFTVGNNPKGNQKSARLPQHPWSQGATSVQGPEDRALSQRIILQS